MWMLRNFYKTTSGLWRRTPGTWKGSPFSSKGGRAKYKRQKERQKSQGRRPVLGRESWRRRSFRTAGNPLTGRPVRSFEISEGNTTGRGKKKARNPQNMRLTTTPSGEVAQTLSSTTSERGLDREAQAALLRVRTGPECPEDNLRELTWDRNPNCGIARERKKKKREDFLAKSSNLRCRLVHSQKQRIAQTPKER